MQSLEGTPISFGQEFRREQTQSHQRGAPREFDTEIMQAPISQPYDFLNMVASSKDKKIVDFKKGTTTLGFVFQGGILFAVDSRATMGAYISSESVRKVIPISTTKLATIAGGAADCQYWEAWLAEQVRLYELKHGKQPSVAATSRMMVNLINAYKQYGLSMGLMLAGCDEKGPSLYYINTEGSRVQGNIFSVGSGMTYAYGVLDTFYRYDLTLDEAVELGRKAIYHATFRDTASGGMVRVYHVFNGGWKEIVAGDDVNKLHYEYEAQKGLTEDRSVGRIS